MASRWSELPAEVPLLIFKQYGTIDERWDASGKGALVCKNWNRLLEPLIYVHVLISTTSQHAKFNDTLVNSNKCGLVKRIGFKPEYETSSVKVYRTTFGPLPRLELLITPPKFSYMPLADAIIQGRLTELEYINAPRFDDRPYNRATLDSYATCVLLLKDRLKKVVLFDTTSEGELPDQEEMNQLSIFYEKISQIIDQPHSFTLLNVKKKTNDKIDYVESIMRKCMHLDTLCLFMEPDSLDEETSQWTPSPCGRVRFDDDAMRSEY